MTSAFPMNSALISISFEVFKGTRESLLLMVPLVMVTRSVLNLVTMKGHLQHWKIIEDTVLFFIGIYCLESVLMLVMEIPASAQDLIASTDTVVLDKVPDKFYIFSFAMGLSDLIDYLTVLVFHILSIVYLLLMSLAIILGGYVIFFATMFQVRKVFTVFVMIIFFLSLWPFLWYSIDKTFEHILKVQNDNASAVGAGVSVLMMALLKLAVPVAGFFGAVKAPAGLAAAGINSLKSGFSSTKAGVYGTAKVAGNQMGIGKVASYAGIKAREAVSQPIDKMRSMASSPAPALAYGVSKAMGRPNAQGGFKAYRANMDQTVAYGRTRGKSSHVKSSGYSSGSASKNSSSSEGSRTGKNSTSANAQNSQSASDSQKRTSASNVTAENNRSENNPTNRTASAHTRANSSGSRDNLSNNKQANHKQNRAWNNASTRET